MKISWFSNAPFCTTGYGNQTKLFTPRLRDIAGHEVAISAFYGLHGAVLNWDGIQLYPGGHHPYGQDVVTAHAAHQEADLVITLMDAWVCEPQGYGHGIPWCVTEDTLITMADGSQKAIRDIQVGDELKGADNGLVVTTQVIQTHTIPSELSGRLLRLTTADGAVLDVTADNTIWASKDGEPPTWIPAGDLATGDMVYLHCNKPSDATKDGVSNDQSHMDTRRGPIPTGSRRSTVRSRDRAGIRENHYQRASSCLAVEDFAGSGANIMDTGRRTISAGSPDDQHFRRDRAGIEPNGDECATQGGTQPVAEILCQPSATDAYAVATNDRYSSWLSRGIDGRRRVDLDYSTQQIRPGNVPVATTGHDLRHRSDVGRISPDDIRCEGTDSYSVDEEQPPHVASRLVRVPVLPHRQTRGTTLTDQARSGADRDRISGEPNQSRHLQSGLHGARDGLVRADSWLESTRIVGLEVRTSPEFVYDLTTTTSNFFAGNILIHNCPWYPIDSEPLPRRIYDAVIQSFQPIVFSRFGEQVATEAGLDVRYVPHGVDTTALAPMDRDEARERLQFPQDRFIVGIVSANKGNPSRKALTEQMLAFRMFKDRHPDALLYMHMTTGQRGEMGGENLVGYANSLGLSIGEDVLFADQYALLLGLGDDYMQCVYNAIDVLMCVSKGEGFGIPIIEAQACGCPVIVGDWTAMSELCLSGWKVPKEHATPWWTPLETYQYIPRPSAIASCLGQAYAHWGDQEMRDRARRLALNYDADRITREFWVPVLAEIEQRLAGTSAPAEPVTVGSAS